MASNIKIQRHMTKILSLCNHKGGVGKTTSAVNIAAGLARLGSRVLLVDIDPQANTTQAVGMNPYTIGTTIYDALIGKAEKLPVLNVWDRVDVVPSCLQLMAAEIQLVNEYGRERLLESLLEPIRDGYDFVLVDCPPSAGLLTVNALTASDALLVPVLPHFFAVQGLQQLVDVVARVRRGLNKRLVVGGVFITDYDGRARMHTDAAAAIEQAFPDELFTTRIRHNVALSESAARGLSIYDYNPRSNGAKDYAALTDEIYKRFAQ